MSLLIQYDEPIERYAAMDCLVCLDYYRWRRIVNQKQIHKCYQSQI